VALPSKTADLLNALRSIKAARGLLDADEWRRVHDAELRRPAIRSIQHGPTKTPYPQTRRYNLQLDTRRRPTCTGDSSAVRLAAQFVETACGPVLTLMKCGPPPTCCRKAGDDSFLAVAAAEGAAAQSWDVPGAYMRAPTDPRYRVTMQQPPNFDGTLAAPGKVCVLRRAMPRAPDANALWEHFRDYWLKSWGWTQVLSEPSMFIQEVGPGQYARMEADNDDFLITAPTEEHIDRLARPLEDAWQITKQKLSPRLRFNPKSGQPPTLLTLRLVTHRLSNISACRSSGCRTVASS
jgi:hypothetical protein